MKISSIIKIFVLIIALCLALALGGCHSHVSAGTVSCTEDELCAECGQVIRAAMEHTPGPEATCKEDQVCTVCGEVIAKAAGHQYAEVNECVEDTVCLNCGEVLKTATGHTPGPEASSGEPQVCEVCGEILNYISADGSGNTVDFVRETINVGHYDNNVDAYYSGNVLVCGDYALEYFWLNESGNSNYADLVNRFAEKYPNLNVTNLLIPKSCAFNSPEGFNDLFQNEQSFITNTYAMMNDSVKKADCIGVLEKHAGEYMFYRTDHHWTSLGAYYASVAFCNANSIEPLALSDYETVINTGFIGTLYGYSYNPKPKSLLSNPDYTVGHLPQTGYDMKYTTSGVTYSGTAINENATSYASMFICGDQAFTRIMTDNHNGRKLVVFKESYGNAFVPYMIDYFEEIIVLDIRYDAGSTQGIINDYGITDALIINNVQGAASLQEYLSTKLFS